jgi:hypothetical protein
MQTSEILLSALKNIKDFAKTDINEESFKKNVAELKAVLHNLKKSISSSELEQKVESIIKYRVVSQRHPIEQFFFRYFGSQNNHTWPYNNWNKKGKYLYDLEILEIKLSGLIHQVNENKLT